jgi:acyl carrier protein
MSNPTNDQRLVDCFVKALGINRESVTESLAYDGIPEWDSIGHMTLMTEIETAFDVMLDTEDIINIGSVAQARRILTKHGVSF